MTKLSVVVIIYRIEKYLVQCIESILSQTYSDFELILVDDGSPDKCPQICDEFAEKDDRIKVIHQKNQGPVLARWNGLLASSGEYVSLIDGDDWLDSDMYERMLHLAGYNKSDIVVVGYKEGTERAYIQKSNKIKSGLYIGDSLQEMYSRVLYTGEFYKPGIVPALWNKLIKRELFFKDYIPADPILRMGEDAAVSYPMIARAKSIVIENEFHPYHYRVAECSMSRKYDSMYLNRCLELFKGLSRNLEINTEMCTQLKYYTLFIIEIGILQLCSKKSCLSVQKQKQELEHFYKEYVNLNIDMNYNWNAMEDSNRKWLEQFISGNINKTLIELYKRKIINKVRVLHER